MELNNWAPDAGYPDEEPFRAWMDPDGPILSDADGWCAQRGICSVSFLYDLSCTWLLTIPKAWAEDNIPRILEPDLEEWLCKEAAPGVPPMSSFGVRFRALSAEDAGDIEIDWDTCRILGTGATYAG